MSGKLTLGAAIAALCLGLAACEDKGPVEQAGEEVDEAVDTLKRGGDESPASAADDAMDEAREAAQDAAEEIRQN